MPFSSPTSMPTLTSFVTSVSYQWTGYEMAIHPGLCKFVIRPNIRPLSGDAIISLTGKQATIHNFDGLGCFREILDPAPNLGRDLSSHL